MSDDHRGPSHDLPLTKAKVHKATDGAWYWGHACHGGGWAHGLPYASQPMALRGALRHMEACS